MLCFAGFAGAFRAHAGISACSVSVSPQSLVTNVSGTLNFSVTNGDGALEAKWVKISAPSENFEINSGNASGWPADVQSPTEIVFRNGTLAAGSNANFGVSVQTGLKSAVAASWNVRISDQQNGADAVGCSGDTNVAIIGADSDTTPPVISNGSVTDITDTGATIKWETDELATSVVEYGITSGYGEKKEDPIFKKTHSVNLSGLLPDTTYHYRLRSVDAAGNAGQSSDNTFTTAKATATPTPTPVPTSPPDTESSSGSESHSEAAVSNTPKPTVKPKPKPTSLPSAVPVFVAPSDRTAPRVSLNTDFSITYENAPQISGRATDAGGVVGVEYSVDGGLNWLPAGGAKGNVVDFSFTPRLIAEDSYQIVVRARDTSGNAGLAKAKLVIDRLPPLTGPALVSFGPQVLAADSFGVLSIMAGVDLRVTVSATGGPDTIDLTAENGGESQLFSLVKNPQSGLWSGKMSFAKAGNYRVIAKAEDGAKRITEREILVFSVLERATIRDNKGGAVGGAEIGVYVLDAISNRFVLWDGEPFDLANPVLASEAGEFSLTLPAGDYYLAVKKKGQFSGRTPIFHNDGVRSVSANLTVARNRILGVFWPVAVKMKFNDVGRAETEKNALIDKEVPLAGLIGASGGKPTVLSFVSTWMPDTAEQLKNLDSSREGADFASTAVLVQAAGPETQIFKNRGGYAMSFFADVLGETIAPFGLRTLPATYFIDAKGIVRAARTGVLTKEEIKKAVTGLEK